MKSNPNLHNLTKLILALTYLPTLSECTRMRMDQSSISPDVEIPLSFDKAALVRTKLYA